jgi:5'-deoxynucleotidase YfbR-like HD superfamily hydrolase
MMTPESVYVDARLAGQVIRYHTWPQVRQQSVGEHSWQLLRIYSCVVDKIDPDFVLHCIYHDTGELGVGDNPYPVKADNPILKEQINKLEKESIDKQSEYWGPVAGETLSDEQMKLFKLIEMIEMFEWGLDEYNRGSKYGFVVAERCLKVVYDRLKATEHLPPAWKRLAHYVQKRLQLDISYEDMEGIWWDWFQWERLSK